ncbi:MAG: hypothetical protein ACJ8DY_02710, partial [Xanthobacteraceae bacterium]
MLEAVPRLRCVSVHGRAIRGRWRAGLAVAPIASTTAAASPPAAPFAVAVRLAARSGVICAVTRTNIDVCGFHCGGILDGLSLAFAIGHDRRDRLIGWRARLAWLAATAPATAPAPPPAATARLLAAARVAVLAACLQDFLFVLALA